MIEWLNASIHQKNTRIDSLTVALQTIQQTVRCVGIDALDQSGSKTSLVNSTPPKSEAAERGRDSTASASPAALSSMLPDSALLHAVDHFSIADSDEEF